MQGENNQTVSKRIVFRDPRFNKNLEFSIWCPEKPEEFETQKRINAYLTFFRIRKNQDISDLSKVIDGKRAYRKIDFTIIQEGGESHA